MLIRERAEGLAAGWERTWLLAGSRKNDRSAWGRSGHLEGGREGEKLERMLFSAFRFRSFSCNPAGDDAVVSPQAERIVTNS